MPILDPNSRYTVATGVSEAPAIASMLVRGVAVFDEQCPSRLGDLGCCGPCLRLSA